MQWFYGTTDSNKFFPRKFKEAAILQSFVIMCCVLGPYDSPAIVWATLNIVHVAVNCTGTINFSIKKLYLV